MSREFGSYESGYFHYQMELAADDCLGGGDELTRLWGAFFKEFKEIAYAISSSEAGDSSPAYPIFENIKRMDALEKNLSAIKSYLDVYRRVADDAVEGYVRAQKVK